MKLSEGMIAGSTLITRNPNAYLQFLDEGKICGCAIGAGMMANGANADNFVVGGTINKMFPWLRPPVKFEQITQFDMGIIMYDGITKDYDWVVSDLFRRVCRDEMTYESLADWVRSVEPECGECNSFQCACQKGHDIDITTEEEIVA